MHRGWLILRWAIVQAVISFSVAYFKCIGTCGWNTWNTFCKDETITTTYTVFSVAQTDFGIHGRASRIEMDQSKDADNKQGLHVLFCFIFGFGWKKENGKRCYCRFSIIRTSMIRNLNKSDRSFSPLGKISSDNYSL